jgi:ketosteroid isomerase-like protein
VTTTAHPQDILALESRRIAAMVAQDMATLDAMLADDLSYTHSNGTTDTKASFMELVRNPGDHGRYLGVDYRNEAAVALGDAAIVRGIAQITLEGTGGKPDRSYPVLFLDVWERRGGTWRLVAWQATRLKE